MAEGAGTVVPGAARSPHAGGTSSSTRSSSSPISTHPPFSASQIAPGRSILVPTAHDEPAIHLDIYKEMFALPAAVAYNTEVEAAFPHHTLPGAGAAAEETVGCGVDLPASDARERPSKRKDPRREPGHRRPPVRRLPAAACAHHRARRSVRRRHRLHGRLLLYGGRIHPGKGCEGLIESIQLLCGGWGDATLALMGVKLMKLPDEPFIRFAGLLFGA